MKKSYCKGRIGAKGFTLIEVLVVVLIIAALAAVALPQYQKAVLKSRYSGLMPIASAVANGQEIYYMDKGHYSTDITQLDIKAPSGGASAEIEVNDGSDERFDYVLTTRDDVPGLAYVVYQKHSPQFADTVMCEANDELNPNATWLCKDALKGEEVTTGSLQGTGWTAYIIKGTEGGSTFEESGGCSGEKPGDILASRSGARGTAVCNESTGEYQYVWTDGNTYKNSTQCTGDEEYACAGAIMVGSYTFCRGKTENGCTNSTFSNNAFCTTHGMYSETWAGGAYGCANSTFTTGADCYGYTDNGCANSTFTGTGAICYGDAENSCANSTFTDGSFCKGTVENACAGSTFIDSYCAGQGCDQAEYSGTGCCDSGCATGAPKCSYHYVQVGSSNNKVIDGWDGETYW